MNYFFSFPFNICKEYFLIIFCERIQNLFFDWYLFWYLGDIEYLFWLVFHEGYKSVHKNFTKVIWVFHEGYRRMFTRIIGSQVFHEGYKSVFMSVSQGLQECVHEGYMSVSPETFLTYRSKFCLSSCPFELIIDYFHVFRAK